MSALYVAPITIILSLLINQSLKISEFDQDKSIVKFSEKAKNMIIIAYLIFIFFSVFRKIAQGGVGGTDAYGYMNYFNTSPRSIIQSIKNQGYEPGYAGFIWFMRMIFTDYKIVLFITHSYMYYSMVQFMRRFKYNKFTIIASVLMMGLLMNSFNIIRMVLSVCISFNIYSSLYESKVLKALLISIFAVTVHISAAIMIPIVLKYAFYLYDDEITASKMLVINLAMYVLSIVAILSIDFIIVGTKYTFYQGKEESIAVVSFAIMLITYIGSLMKYSELIELSKMNKILISSIPIGLVILPLQFKMSIMYRMILFINPLLFMLIPQIIYLSYKKSGYKILDFMLTTGFSLIVSYKIYQFFFIESKDLGIPYLLSFFK